MEFNMFGIPHVGSDVCGFNEPSNEELCLRWQQLGAFHPFYRNHNSKGQRPQHSASWKSVAVATRAATMFRYQLFPTLYSLHFRVSLHGGTVVRPLLFEFVDDFNTHQIDYQFLLGPSIMVVPVINANVDTVHAYFPIGAQDFWYSISEAHEYGANFTGGSWHTLDAPRNTALPCFLREGTIIQKQKPELTITATRQNDFHLIVGLDHNSLSAAGELFWDDGESIVTDFGTIYHFEFLMTCGGNVSVLTIICDHAPAENKSLHVPKLSGIEIFGGVAPKLEEKNFGSKILNVHLDNNFLEIDSRNIKFNKKSVKIEVPDSGFLVDLNEPKAEWRLQWENAN